MKLTSAKSHFISLPLRVDSAFLAQHRREGEPIVLVKVAGIGNVAPYEYRGRGARCYILRWELKLNAHVLRVPLHLWMQNDHWLAHDLLEHDTLPLPIVILIETPQAAAATAEDTAPARAPVRRRRTSSAASPA